LALRIDTQRPALVAQVYDRDRASELKLQLLALYPPDHPVTLLAAAGTPDARAENVPLAEIDHRAPGYLHSVYLPPLEPVEDGRRFDGLAHIVERLNAPGGCPWDREQTHVSLRHYLL